MNPAKITRRSALRLAGLGAGSSLLAASPTCKTYAQARGGIDKAVEWAKANLPNSTPEIVEGAAKEGKLSLLLPIAGTDESVQGVIKKFNERYPFINVTYVQQITDLGMRRFNAELDSKKGITDCVALLSNLSEVNKYAGSGAVSEFVISQDRAFPDSAKKSGFWYAWMREFALTVYRKDALNDEEKQLVRTYQGLGDPRFKGRLGISGISNSGVQSDCYVLMNEPGLATWKAIAANKPLPKSAASALLDGLLSGQYDVGLFAGAGASSNAVRGGAPVEFLVSSPHSVRFFPGAISVLAPNPNSARLWQDWIMSKEGQQAWSSQTGTFSVRDDVSDPAIAREPWFFEDKSAQVPIDWDNFGKKIGGVVERYKADIQSG